MDCLNEIKIWCFRIKRCFLSEGTALILLLTSVVLLLGIVISYNCCRYGCVEGLGALTGGVVVCIIYIANTIFLYRTLVTQIEGNKSQKEMAKQERFETTLFNLLDNYFDQLNRIKFDVVMLKNPPKEVYTVINGSSLLTFAIEQLNYLKAYFAKDNYLGYYDLSSDSLGYDYKTTPEEISEYNEHLRTKYMANIYGISQQKYEQYKEQIRNGEKTLLQICYCLFYSRWGIGYDHYIRMVITIVEYIKLRGNNISETDYMALFKGYISSKEQRFLNYHASIDKEFADALQGTTLLAPDLLNN